MVDEPVAPGTVRATAFRHWWVVLPALVITRLSYSWRHFQLDDALIYLRYVRNFRNGNGLVYNPGDRFNGLTSPLFSYVMAAGSFVTQRWQLLSIGVSAAFFLVAAVAFGLAFGDRRAESALIATAVAACPYFYSTFGMETPMLLAVVALALYLRRRDSDYMVVALAVLVGTRAEGVFLALPMAIEYLVRHRRLPRVLPTVLAAVIVAVPFAVNLTYYGHLLPGTAAAKFGQGRSGYWSQNNNFLRVGYLKDQYFSGDVTTVALLCAAAIAGVALTARRRTTQHAVIYAVALFAFYWGLKLPNYHWYYAPFIALIIVFAAKALATAGLGDLRVGTVDARALISAPMVAAVIIAANTLTLYAFGRNEPYVAASDWITKNTPADQSIALNEIGTVGWYTDRPIIDILGLSNERNADFIADSDLFGWLTVYQPDLILRAEPPWSLDAGALAMQNAGAYAPLADFPVPGWVLLGKTGAFSDAEIADLAESLRPD